MRDIPWPLLEVHCTSDNEGLKNTHRTFSRFLLRLLLWSLTTELTGPDGSLQTSVRAGAHLLRDSCGTSRGTEEDLARRLPAGSARSPTAGSADNLSVDLLAKRKERKDVSGCGFMQTLQATSKQANPEGSMKVKIKDSESRSEKASVSLRFLICREGTRTATTGRIHETMSVKTSTQCPPTGTLRNKQLITEDTPRSERAGGHPGDV